MSFAVKELSQITADILRDISNNLNGAVVTADSDFAVRANADAAAIEGLYQHQQWIFNQIFPDRADTENLEHHCRDHGISRNQPTLSSGMATLSGTVGSLIPAATALKFQAIAFVTTADAVIAANGTVSVAIAAVATGTSGNLPIGTGLTLTSAPTGVSSVAVLSTATTGGTDVESDEDLLTRLLFILQNPPQGGTKSDYKIWAGDVDGVGFQFVEVYSQRRAANSVDIVIRDQAGTLPSAALIAATQSAIDLKRPVTADCLVFGPTAVSVVITGGLTLASGYLLVDVVAAINTSMVAYFVALKPGDTVIKNKLINLILAVDGVIDVNLTAPAANVVTVVNATYIQLATLGTVTLS